MLVNLCLTSIKKILMFLVVSNLQRVQVLFVGKVLSVFSQGESFYNPHIPGVIKQLSDLGLVEESQGARVIFIEGINIPLIVVKSDGGYNYASTDLTALWQVFTSFLFDVVLNLCILLIFAV